MTSKKTGESGPETFACVKATVLPGLTATFPKLKICGSCLSSATLTVTVTVPSAAPSKVSR